MRIPDAASSRQRPAALPAHPRSHRPAARGARGALAGLRTHGRTSGAAAPEAAYWPSLPRPEGPVLDDGGRSRSPLRGSPGFPPGSLLRRPLRTERPNQHESHFTWTPAGPAGAVEPLVPRRLRGARSGPDNGRRGRRPRLTREPGRATRRHDMWCLDCQGPPTYGGACSWFRGPSRPAGVRGNPVRFRDCPAAVSGNDSRPGRAQASAAGQHWAMDA
jgi:hypothetical protein